MADMKKAQMHHGKAGAALKAGDAKGAAHHFGHALAALRTGGASMGEVIPAAKPKPVRSFAANKNGADGLLDTDTNTPGINTNGPARSASLSLRGRLKKFGKPV